MKRIIFALLLLFTLTACTELIIEEEDDDLEIIYEYSDFESISISTHYEAEGKSNDKYIVYYYGKYCSYCNKVKQDILAFANDFDDLDFYIFETSGAVDYSIYEEYIGTPSVFVISGGIIIEEYIGSDKVIDFINLYSDIVFDYDLLSSQHLTEYDQLLDITSERYLVYYYSDTCQSCTDIKNQVISWAFTKNVDEIYLINSNTVTDPNIIPTDLQILSSGTPLLIVMNNGVFTQEYYLGKDDIQDYVSADSN